LARYKIYKILPYKEAFIRALFNEYIIGNDLTEKYDWEKLLENKVAQLVKIKTVALSVGDRSESTINGLILSSRKGKSYQERARYHFHNGDRKGALRILNAALTEDKNSLIDFGSLEQLIDAGETLDAYRITTTWLMNSDFYGNYKLVKIAATLAIQLEKNKEGIHLLRRLINLERDDMVNNSLEKRLRVQSIFQNIFFCYWDMADLKEAHKVLTEMESAGCHYSAFVLEWKSRISFERMNFRSCLKHAHEYMQAFPEYSQTAYGLIQKGLLSQRKFIDLKAFIAEKEIPLASDLFDAGLTETDLCSFADLSLNRKPCHIFDLTSLTIALESGASFGGIERTLVELTYNIINSSTKDVVFITWKNMIPVIVRPIDFMASIFSERAASDKPNTINTSKLTKFDTLYSPLPGDVIVIAGSVWHYDPNCDKHKYLTNSGASPIYLVYDLLQIVFPQLVSEKWSARFEGWVSRVIKLSSVILVDSKYASREIQQYSRLNNIDISSQELVEIELGDNFMPMALSRKFRNFNTNSIITDRPYVLYVSSISARKIIHS
jgi:tetratricopeptide (TPR) repeat protein